MEINQIKNYVTKNLYTGIIKTSVTLVLSVIAIPVVIKNIGLSAYGIISIALVFSNFTGAIDLGLSRALISYCGNEEKNQKEISAIYFLNLLLFTLVFFIAVMVYLFNINIMGENLKINIETIRLVNFVALLLLSFELLNNLLRATLEAKFKLQLVNWGFLIQSVIINLGWLILSITKSNILVFLLIPVLSSLVTIIYHLILLPSTYKNIEIPDRVSLKNVFNITFNFFKVGSLNSIHLPLMKYAIILFIGDGRVIGIFELATKLSVLANNLMSYISNPFFSIASKLKDSSVIYLWKTIKKATLLLIIVSIVGYLIFLVFNKFIIDYFYGEYSWEIFNVLNIVLLGYLFVAMSESLQKFYLGIGEINLVAKIKFISVLINILCIILFYFLGLFNLTVIAFTYSFSMIFFGSYWLFLASRKNLITRLTTQNQHY